MGGVNSCCAGSSSVQHVLVLFQALTDAASVLIATNAVGITFALYAGVGHRATRPQRIRASSHSEKGLGRAPTHRNIQAAFDTPRRNNGARTTVSTAVFFDET